MPASKKVLFLGLFTFLAVTFSIYYPALHNRYALDDVPIVRDNPLVQEPNGISKMFWNAVERPYTGLYRPLPVASFWLSHRVSPDPAPADHLINILLHTAFGFLVFLFLLHFRFHAISAGFLTLVFLAHPVNVEVVASLVGRCDQLAALFSFLALLVALRVPQGSVFRAGALCLSFFAALLSKESALAMVLVIPLLERLDRRTGWRQLLFGTFLPLAAALAVYLPTRYAVLGVFGIDRRASIFPAESFWAAREMALAWFSLFFEKLFVPLPLVPDYATGVFTVYDANFYFRVFCSIAALSAIAGTTGYYLLRRKSLQPLLISLVLFLIVLLPVSNLVFLIGSPFAERFLYLPLPFLLIGFGHRVFSVQSHGAMKLRTTWSVVLLVVLFLLAGISWARTPAWRDNITLARAGVRDLPENFRLRMALATEYLKLPRPELAEPEFTAAARILPEHYEPWLNLGNIAFEKGDYSKAERAYLKALRRAPEPQRRAVQMNLSLTYQQLRRTREGGNRGTQP
ncbi:MAG: tetratricopeptide repeat protein [Pseudomonadota bacterium]